MRYAISSYGAKGVEEYRPSQQIIERARTDMLEAASRMIRSAPHMIDLDGVFLYRVEYRPPWLGFVKDIKIQIADLALVYSETLTDMIYVGCTNVKVN